MIADASSAETRASRIGRVVPGHAIPVIDERAVRAAAGIMFLLGGAAFATAFFTGSAQPLQPFGMFFMIDMLLRVTAGDRWSPTLMLGRLAVKGQRPEWVGAPQKELTWWLGLALVACASMGLFAAPLWIPPRALRLLSHSALPRDRVRHLRRLRPTEPFQQATAQVLSGRHLRYGFQHPLCCALVCASRTPDP